ncbi:MAG: UDP-N-acetylmuramate dehydrogenase [Candidatus Scalinduaceae bacterium]
MISNIEIVDDIFQYDVSLQRYTSFKTGGVAEIFTEPRDISELKRVLQYCKNEQKKIFILGNGSNVLVNDNGIQGVVIYLGGTNFKNVKRNDNYVLSEAGTNLSQLIRKTSLWGLEGLELLVGIPGTVGGAVMMNAGGKYGSISETISSVTTMTFDGEIRNHNREDVDFTYRGCNLTEQIVIEVKFVLKESIKEKILARMNNIYKEKKEKQPLSTFNAGCVFKNTHRFKAAELIDKAGLKGKNVGGAIVSEKHANFIVNVGNATSNDILELIKIVKETIKGKYNISLELEIKIW